MTLTRDELAALSDSQLISRADDYWRDPLRPSVRSDVYLDVLICTAEYVRRTGSRRFDPSVMLEEDASEERVRPIAEKLRRAGFTYDLESVPQIGFENMVFHYMNIKPLSP